MLNLLRTAAEVAKYHMMSLLDARVQLLVTLRIQLFTHRLGTNNEGAWGPGTKGIKPGIAPAFRVYDRVSFKIKDTGDICFEHELLSIFVAVLSFIRQIEAISFFTSQSSLSNLYFRRRRFWAHCRLSRESVLPCGQPEGV
jgi:hypothetical protein